MERAPVGHLDNPALLDQCEAWVDAKGETHLVADMHPAYVRNVVNFLERHAGGVEHLYTVAELSRMSAAVGTVDDASGASAEAVISDPARITDPLSWLRSTPLVASMRARLGWYPDDTSTRLEGMAEAAWVAAGRAVGLEPGPGAVGDWDALDDVTAGLWRQVARAVDAASRRAALRDVCDAYRAAAIRAWTFPSLAGAEASLLADRAVAASNRAPAKARFLYEAARRVHAIGESAATR